MKKFFMIAIGLIAGVLIILIGRKLVDPYGSQLRSITPYVDPVAPAATTFSANFHSDYARLFNNIGRKSNWSEADVDWVNNILLSGWPDIAKDTSDPTYEGWKILSTALTIVGERISSGIPMDESVKSSYIDTVRLMLDHPQGYVRQRGVTASANAGLLSSSSFRSKILFIRDNDPFEGARRSARIKLDQDSGLKTTADDCPTCPKEKSP
ncbi:MAG: hypothetical protein ACSHX5_03725 [Phycisphaerales bacterium]